jgi:tetratricopeptide (TPR) repeat protein
MEDFDKLWNYNAPADTEIKFREVLDKSENASPDYRLQLMTQIARTFSLRGMFAEAHQLLDTVKPQLTEHTPTAKVRYFLERGRTFNSSGDKASAKVKFDLAENFSRLISNDFYTLDAMHMLAIVAPPTEAVGINEHALLFAEKSNQEKAKRWLGSLYNNLGWSYFDLKEHEKALSIFLRALQWREQQQSATEIFIAKWCVARALRALNRTDDSLKIQLALFEESVTTGNSDGYVHEELGELFLLKGDKLKSVFHFQKAYEMLSSDRHLQQHEKERIERIKQLTLS